MRLQDPTEGSSPGGIPGAGMGRASGELAYQEWTQVRLEPSVVREAFIILLTAFISWEKQVIPEYSTLFPNKVNVAESRNLFCLQFDFLAC